MVVDKHILLPKIYLSVWVVELPRSRWAMYDSSQRVIYCASRFSTQNVAALSVVLNFVLMEMSPCDFKGGIGVPNTPLFHCCCR